MKKITVVGGGFSGMTLAYYLAKRGFAVDLHERSNRLGGLIHTYKTENGLVETAANALIRTQNLEELFSELDFSATLPLATSKARFLFRGRPRRWPLGVFETLEFVSRILFHLITGRKFLQPSAGQTVFEWSNRNLGAPATRYLVSPALQGIYAGDVCKLSATLILKPIFRRKSKHRDTKDSYRGLASGPEGMQSLIYSLEAGLRRHGVQIFLQSDFALASSDAPTVIATSVRQAANLLKPNHPQLSSELAKIETSPLVTATCFWKKVSDRYRGFGCLIPKSEGFRTLGIIMNSCIFFGRGKYHSETFIFGGATDPQIMRCSDEEIKSLILGEREKIFSERNDLLALHIQRWDEALPQYTCDLEVILKQLVLPKNIYLHGNYLGSIGLSKILDRSITLAQEIEAQHG